jgi:hypothetical protein
MNEQQIKNGLDKEAKRPYDKDGRHLTKRFAYVTCIVGFVGISPCVILIMWVAFALRFSHKIEDNSFGF